MLFVVAGLLDLATALAGWNANVGILVALFAFVTAVVASYVFYRRLERPVED